MEGPSRMPKQEQKEEGESLFGEIQWGPETSEQFPGRKIFAFKQDGEYVMYALGRSPSGELEGNKFTVGEKTETGWRNSPSLPGVDRGHPNLRINGAYQMHRPNLEVMEKLLKARGIVI